MFLHRLLFVCLFTCRFCGLIFVSCGVIFVFCFIFSHVVGFFPHMILFVCLCVSLFTHWSLQANFPTRPFYHMVHLFSRVNSIFSRGIVFFIFTRGLICFVYAFVCVYCRFVFPQGPLSDDEFIFACDRMRVT